MADVRKMSKETQCVHASLMPDENGAVVPPIYQTSTFKFRDADHGAALFAGREKGYIYTRMANPTIEAVEERLIAFIEEELLSPGETVTRVDDLLSGELFDSIGVLRLAAFVEEDFSIAMEPSDFVIENFQNIGVLAEYILRAYGER